MNSFTKYIFLAAALCSSLVVGESCICAQIYKPVCSSIGVTFSNLCEFQCAQSSRPELSVISDGPCPDIDSDDTILDRVEPAFEEEEIPTCACSLQYQPVCGTDGSTYGNLCQLNCARKSNPSLDMQSFGACGSRKNGKNLNGRPRCFCTREYRPICSSDSVTYSNRCEFNCAQKLNPQLSISHEGSCNADEEP